MIINLDHLFTQGWMKLKIFEVPHLVSHAKLRGRKQPNATPKEEIARPSQISSIWQSSQIYIHLAYPMHGGSSHLVSG